MKREHLSSRKSVSKRSPKVDNVLNGFNATVFAYGATGYYLVHENFIFLMKIKSLTDEKQIFSLMRNQFSMWMLFVAGGGKTYTMVGQPVTLFTFSSCPPMYSIFVIEPNTNFRKHNPQFQFSIIFPIPPSALFSFKCVTKP